MDRGNIQVYLNDVAGHKSKTEAACRYYESKYSRPGDDIAQQTELYMADALQQIATDVERLSTQLIEVIEVQSYGINDVASKVESIHENINCAKQETSSKKEKSLRRQIESQPVFERVTPLDRQRRGQLPPHSKISLQERLDDVYPAPDMHVEEESFSPPISRRSSVTVTKELSQTNISSVKKLVPSEKSSSMYALPLPRAIPITSSYSDSSANLAPPVLLSKRNGLN